RAADVLPQLELLPGQQAVAVEVAVDVRRVERVRPRLLAGVRVGPRVQVQRRLVLPAIAQAVGVGVDAARVGPDALLEAIAQRILVLVARRVGLGSGEALLVGRGRRDARRGDAGAGRADGRRKLLA